MGDLRPDNGGLPPDDGKAHGLPDLPPEWGTIVIPDDPAELADEADALRRELRGSARRTRLRQALGLSPGQPSALGIPVVIMTVAILTTLVSLLVVTWGNAPTGSDPAATGTHANPPAATAPAPDLKTPFNDLAFTTSAGDRVRVGDIVPTVFLLVDGCACGPLVSSVSGAVPPGVRVVPVTTGAPAQAGTDPTNVLRLVDSAGTLRARFPANTAPDGSATAIVVSKTGTIVAAIPHVTSVADIKPLNPG